MSINHHRMSVVSAVPVSSPYLTRSRDSPHSSLCQRTRELHTRGSCRLGCSLAFAEALDVSCAAIGLPLAARRLEARDRPQIGCRGHGARSHARLDPRGPGGLGSCRLGNLGHRRVLQHVARRVLGEQELKEPKLVQGWRCGVHVEGKALLGREKRQKVSRRTRHPAEFGAAFKLRRYRRGIGSVLPVQRVRLLARTTLAGAREGLLQPHHRR
mmetsp:Transcript_11648/g.29845  ORF Transcript_11648/g.29845 Transcript_11648/m.29845 type:complete len:213 (+) Transcript_11648:64-702(+)